MNYPNDPTTRSGQPYPPNGQMPPPPGYPQPQYPQQPQFTPPGYPQPGYPPMPPQQLPKKKSKKGLIIAGILVGAIVLCGVIGAMASNGNTGSKVGITSTNSSTINTGKTDQKQSVMQQHFKVGDVVKVGDSWEVTINSVTTNQGSEYFKPDSGNVYLMINVSMKNVSDKEQNTSSLLDWNLKDKDGQRYKDALFTDGDSPPNGKVEAGGPAKGTLAYEVPATIKEFTLSFSPELFASGQTIWDITAS